MSENSKHENNCINVLEKLWLYTSEYSQWLDQDDFNYIENYCEAVINAFDAGHLTEKDMLANISWSDFNIRCGANSILGTYREVVACVLWNKDFNISSRFSLSPSNKKLQVDGVDIIVTNSSWRSNYTVQVKGLYISNNQLITYPDFFKYDHVDRLVLVNEQSKKLIHVNYQKLKAMIANPYKEGHIPLSTLSHNKKPLNFAHI